MLHTCISTSSNIHCFFESDWMHLNGPPLGILRTLSRGRLAASQRSPPPLLIKAAQQCLCLLCITTRARARDVLGSERVTILRLRRRTPPPPPRVPAARTAERPGSVQRRGRIGKPDAGAGSPDPMPGAGCRGIAVKGARTGTDQPLHRRAAFTPPPPSRVTVAWAAEHSGR